jgi:hypothetical protein
MNRRSAAHRACQQTAKSEVLRVHVTSRKANGWVASAANGRPLGGGGDGEDCRVLFLVQDRKRT